MFQRIPVMIANPLCAGVREAAAPGLIAGEADEVDAIGQACLDIVRIVANEDDALGRQAKFGNRAGEDPRLAPPPLAPKARSLTGSHSRQAARRNCAASTRLAVAMPSLILPFRATRSWAAPSTGKGFRRFKPMALAR